MPRVRSIAADASWQARIPDGLTSDRFALDWAAQVAVCPQGQRSRSWRLGTDKHGQPEVDITFATRTCQTCPLHARCTQNQDGRRLKLSIYHEAIVAARRTQRTPAFKQEYARRAGIEGTVALTAGAYGGRRTRYIGPAKTTLQAILTAMAINLRRAALWLMTERPVTTRPPSLACLAQLAA